MMPHGLLSEVDARKKVCPILSYAIRKVVKCRTTGCMLWSRREYYNDMVRVDNTDFYINTLKTIKCDCGFCKAEGKTI